MAQTLWSRVHGALARPINIDTDDLADGPSIAEEMIAALVRSISTEMTVDTTSDDADKETR